MTRDNYQNEVNEGQSDSELRLRKTRKAHHIDLAVQYNEQSQTDAWKDIRFVHHSLPELNEQDIDLTTRVADHTWSVPLYINAMTGGIDEAKVINQNLAEVARKHGLAIAVGSQSAALADTKVVDTYRIVREIMQDGLVLANVSGAVPANEAFRAVEMIQADYLQLHLNFPQEIVMPEGDRNFKGVRANIIEILNDSPVPVIVKEVGFGMSMELYAELAAAGVKVIDVSGRGGTNFAWIESRRRKDQRSVFEDWGQTTPISLLEAQRFMNSIEFLASGGIRTALDMAKALALGAHAVGVAGAVLRVFYKGGKQAVSDTIGTWLHDLRSVMLALGAQSVDDLRTMPIVVTGDSQDWAGARGINIEMLASRSRHG
ncbi:type 2 isopentenyl-diphosphate Delta-isomerase [Alicyclobacillus ferrooxydans]|uniref:Isopentenyl-diphosphate delta-isomerase n=1 Tax=Alicyclobacillus ferrooxydans TaxID=471514 RepID=A0A0P9C629_9BACL|nr:type 2 isopentenyl-diphosphate Delta-isomerase [Alicyclobacillus ferrooxydans]KPV40537.1 hypothetical protein AN477_21900 [Alicyclobacillus ferrooxydans]